MDADIALERAWAAVDEGRAAEGLALLEAVGDGVPERFACAAHAWLQLDEPRRADEAVRALAASFGDDDDEVRWLAALVALARGEPDEALERLDGLAPDDPAWRADVHEQRALALDFLLEHGRADRELARAHAADPEHHPRPLSLAPAELDAVIASAIADLPREFARHLDEIPVVVEPVPSRRLVREGFPADLLGLWDPGHEEAPPRILLFQRNLERAFPDREELAAEIRTTLYHELGHALGFDEEGLEEVGLE